MRLVAFRFPVEHVEGEDVQETLPRVAALIDGDEEICDLTAALPEQWQPIDPINFLKFGEDAFRRSDEAVVDGVARIPIAEIEILSPVPKPGQVVTVAGNYKPFDPSRDDAGEDADAEDNLESSHADEQPDDQPRALDQTNSSDGEHNSVNASEHTDAGEEGAGKEGSDMQSPLGPPESSDDESGASMDEEARRHLQLTLEGKERPVPAFFTKYITSTYGKDSFAYCRAEENSKYLAGAELALIMGRMARRLSEEEALDYVAGIAIGQDFAERDWDTNELRWLYGKAYDAPIGLGPVMLSRDVVKDLDNLKIETWVNDVLVQVGNTRDMEFSCGQILEYVSRFMTLFPGDVILTGRPPPLDGFPPHGVPVEVGDKVTCRISEIGTFSCTLSEADSQG